MVSNIDGIVVSLALTLFAEAINSNPWRLLLPLPDCGFFKQEQFLQEAAKIAAISVHAFPCSGPWILP